MLKPIATVFSSFTVFLIFCCFSQLFVPVVNPVLLLLVSQRFVKDNFTKRQLKPLSMPFYQAKEVLYENSNLSTASRGSPIFSNISLKTARYSSSGIFSPLLPPGIIISSFTSPEALSSSLYSLPLSKVSTSAVGMKYFMYPSLLSFLKKSPLHLSPE